jgi:hypothetical protein
MAYTLLQLQVVYAAMACLLCLGAYEWVAIVVKTTPNMILLNNNFFFVSANVIGMLAGFVIERGVRTDFLQRRVIEMQRREAEKLLRNVLPEEIARRLKAEEGARREARTREDQDDRRRVHGGGRCAARARRARRSRRRDGAR